MKYFLLGNGCRGVFLEMNRDENGNDTPLSDKSVLFVVGKLMDFINSKSFNRWEDIERVCEAATNIFPCIGLVSNRKT